MDATSIQYINGTNDISINDDENSIHKYYVQFLLSNNNEDVSSISEYNSAKQRVSHNKKIILDLLLNKSKSFEWQVSLLFLCYQWNETITTYGSDKWTCWLCWEDTIT